MPSKTKRQIGTVFCRKRSIKMKPAVSENKLPLKRCCQATSELQLWYSGVFKDFDHELEKVCGRAGAANTFSTRTLASSRCGETGHIGFDLQVKIQAVFLYGAPTKIDLNSGYIYRPRSSLKREMREK